MNRGSGYGTWREIRKRFALYLILWFGEIDKTGQLYFTGTGTTSRVLQSHGRETVGHGQNKSREYTSIYNFCRNIVRKQTCANYVGYTVYLRWSTPYSPICVILTLTWKHKENDIMILLWSWFSRDVLPVTCSYMGAVIFFMILHSNQCLIQLQIVWLSATSIQVFTYIINSWPLATTPQQQYNHSI